jgi:hypothetical protein
MFIRVRCQTTWRLSLFPIGSLDEFLIYIGPLVQLQYEFLIWEKHMLQINEEIFARSSNMYSQKTIGVKLRTFKNSIGVC